MRTTIAGHAVEVTRPESPKFTRSLLLLHGLFTGPWIWERFATYLAHRGWESWAPELGATAAVDPAPVAAIVAALPATPIVVAHDVGVLAAATCAHERELPALVAIAPVVAPADVDGLRGIFSWPAFWRARLFGARVAPPRGASAATLLGPAAEHGNRLRDDSGAAFRGVASGGARLPLRLAVPGIVVGGERDAVVPEKVLRIIATRFGWTRRMYPGRGHFPMLDPGWENVADDVHRWIVQTLGADLLAFLDDDQDLQ